MSSWATGATPRFLAPGLAGLTGMAQASYDLPPTGEADLGSEVAAHDAGNRVRPAG
jgi:hypothetical protein